MKLLPLAAIKQSNPLVVQTTLDRFLGSWDLHRSENMLQLILEDASPASVFGGSGFEDFEEGRATAVQFVGFLQRVFSHATGKRVFLDYVYSTGEGVSSTGQPILTEEAYENLTALLIEQQKNMLGRAERLLASVGVGLDWDKDYQLVLCPLPVEPDAEQVTTVG